MYRLIAGLIVLVASLASLPTSYAQCCDTGGCDAYCECEPGWFGCCQCYKGSLWPKNPVCDHMKRFRRKARNHGIEASFLISQIYQGVSDGGLSEEWRYGRYGEYDFNFDLCKLMGLRGWELEIGTEHRVAQQVNQYTGSAVPVALALNLPEPDTNDLAVTEFRFDYHYSRDVEFFFGKITTLKYDTNAFASGKGTTTFLGSAFNYNPVATRTIPFSTLGAGVDIKRGGERVFTFAVLDPRDIPTTSGLSDMFSEGAVIMSEVRVPVRWFGRRGHQAFGATYSSATYDTLFQSGRLDFPDLAIPPQSDSWSLLWNADHYIYQDPCDCNRGWGVFGRAGISDGNPNPVEWSISFGIGGNSYLRGCKDDTFGIGWYYVGISDDFPPAVSAQLTDGQGVEMYYEFEFFKFFRLALDLQVIEPTTPGLDTAIVPGFRSRVEF